MTEAVAARVKKHLRCLLNGFIPSFKFFSLLGCYIIGITPAETWKYRLSAVVSKAMERTPGDISGQGGAIVPATRSMASAHTGAPSDVSAGATPTPMTVDEGFFNQPIQAYFHFVQNNLTYIHEGNIDAFRRAAEERHTQIMEHTVQQLYQEFEQVCL